MIRLKITKASGEISQYDITPAIEFAFETHTKDGFNKRFREAEKNTDVYWLAWEAERRAGITVPPFGEKYLDTLAEVKVEDADSPNG